ncbi:ATP-binding protein [Streptomyces sp. NPDC058755]|uniref:ATP-binding protein n=1 Tax=Streptomyces sp. NPDC058755 TaxID=3346624 RepID=UPI0036BFBA65
MNQKLAGPTELPTQPEGHNRNFSVLLATEQLRAWDLPLDPARHIVGEPANNAAAHGRVPGRNFQLLLYVIGETLRIEVTDTRRDRLPHLRHTALTDEAGRGLLLVDTLADRWGVVQGLPPRKTIWAECSAYCT